MPSNMSLPIEAQQRLLDALPQLLDALVSLAQGTATTAHERRVAAATQRTHERTHKGDHYDRALFPWREEEEMVLVARNTFSHKPDTKALLYLLDLLQSPLMTLTETQQQQPTSPKLETETTTREDSKLQPLPLPPIVTPPANPFWLGPPPRTFWKPEHNIPDAPPSFPNPLPLRRPSPLKTVKNSSFQEAIGTTTEEKQLKRALPSNSTPSKRAHPAPK